MGECMKDYFSEEKNILSKHSVEFFNFGMFLWKALPFLLLVAICMVILSYDLQAHIHY